MTKHDLNNSKFTSKSHLQNNAQKHKFNPNYYPSVAREDSSSIESTCIFPLSEMAPSLVVRVTCERILHIHVFHFYI